MTAFRIECLSPLSPCGRGAGVRGSLSPWQSPPLTPNPSPARGEGDRSRQLMNFLRVKTTECRVGVVGLYNAGKTVFLTSLVNHLRDHDPDRFALVGRDTTVRRFERLPPDPG